MYSDKVWEWKDKEQTTFEALKMAVITALILVSLQDSEPFCVKVDSSDFTMGTILFQQSATDSK